MRSTRRAFQVKGARHLFPITGCRYVISCELPYTFRLNRRKSARPAGFEPATLGSEDRRPNDVNPSDTKDLRQEPNDAVPVLVPSSSQADFAAISLPPADPDLAQILAAWPRLPEAIKAGILAMVQAAGGPDA